MDAVAIANEFGQALADEWARIRHRPGLAAEVRMGADGTPTSQADALLDATIIEVAKQLDVNLLSEESGFLDLGGVYTAIIDPLDGTRNAGRHVPFYCTSVAICKGSLGSIEASRIENLVNGDIYSASTGVPRINGKIPVREHHDELMLSISSRIEDIPLRKQAVEGGHSVRDLGATALELALIGVGAVDGYVTLSPRLRVIDIAAGIHMVRLAGGVVRHADGRPFNMPLDVTVGADLFAFADQDSERRFKHG